MIRIFSVLTVLALTMAQHVNAQVLYGSIVGNVTVATSGAIPNAQVKAVNAGTGQQWELTTGPEGSYATPTLATSGM